MSNHQSHHHPKIHALIVAAGKGSRFGAAVPKQYLRLADRTVLEESIERLNVDGIDDLTLVLAGGDEYASGLDFEFSHPIRHAVGGAERWQSVHSGVQAIREHGGLDDDWVVIHDAARPCLPKVDLARLLDTLESTSHDGVILATPVVDTLKLATNEQGIIKTVDRSGLWQAQTPQAFRLNKLEWVLSQIAKDNLMITDEASGFEMLGLEVQIVQGSKLNMKLTYAEDLPLMELILQNFIKNEC